MQKTSRKSGRGALSGVQFEKPRHFAVRILLRHAQGREFIEDVFEDMIGGSGLKGVDRSLVQEIVYGCVRWQSTLDHFLEKLTKGRTQLPKMRLVLRSGLYQLLMLDRIPGHAAVNESVNVAREIGLEPHTGFVNAVLRSAERDIAQLTKEWEELKVSDPAVGWSHPKWLVARWQKRMSAEDLGALLAWNNQPPPIYARINPLRALPEQTIQSWRDEGIGYDFCSYDWVPENLVFRLKSVPALDRVSSFKKGSFYVQDPSTLLAVSLLDPQPGERILDLCAAPGGKTSFISQLIDDDGEVFASDLDPRRLQLVTENCKRMHITSVTPFTADELANYQNNDGDAFDRVLVDAPCSNTGVIRRRVDLRWRVTPGEIDRLRATQLELLTRGAGLLKTGGSLVYSTCSIEPEENQEVVSSFLSAHPEFTLATERTLFSVRDQVDGAYVAKLMRAK